MRVLLTGGRGMLGSSFLARLRRSGEQFDVIAPTRAELDLRDRESVAEYFAEAKPDAVIHAAAKVAGIAAKLASPLDFLLDNVLMDSSVIDGAIRAGVPRLLYVGTAAAYPAAYVRPYIEAAGARIVTEKEFDYQIKVSGEEQANRLLAALIADRIPVVTFDLREPSLHEIFVETVGGDSDE